MRGGSSISATRTTSERPSVSIARTTSRGSEPPASWIAEALRDLDEDAARLPVPHQLPQPAARVNAGPRVRTDLAVDRPSHRPGAYSLGSEAPAREQGVGPGILPGVIRELLTTEAFNDAVATARA